MQNIIIILSPENVCFLPFMKWHPHSFCSTGQATLHPAVDRLLVRKLENIGVEVVHVDNVTASELSPDMWTLLAADDLNIERFLIRDPTSRFVIPVLIIIKCVYTLVHCPIYGDLMVFFMIYQICWPPLLAFMPEASFIFIQSRIHHLFCLRMDMSCRVPAR